jgi:hypothetical protein
MGARYKELKNENSDLRAALEGFVTRVRVSPGDMVVFKVDPKSIGVPFGVGWGCMDLISRMMSQLAGGAVRCIATTDRQPFAVDQLDKFGRAKLRALLDQLDALADKAEKENTIPRAVATPR